MGYAFVVVGSITTAARLKKTAEARGVYGGSVVHTPGVINQGGCSYSLRIKEELMPRIELIAQQRGIRLKGIYVERIENGRRVYYAVFR
jgi:hypothetical protein